MERWTCSQANDWYAKQPWFRGCNYLPSDCVNRIDMWQSYQWEQHFETASRELAVMESIGCLLKGSLPLHLLRKAL